MWNPRAGFGFIPCKSNLSNPEFAHVDLEQDFEAGTSGLDSDKVMKVIQKLYSKHKIGLIASGKWLDCVPTCPKHKTTVLLVGSHNIAKEKFLDLYFNESRSNAYIGNVDYNNFDKIFIAQGTRRKCITGDTVFEYFPHLENLRKVPGLMNFLKTEIAMKRKKSLVSFILAPEIIRGDNDEVEYAGLDENNNMKTVSQFYLGTAISTLVEAADLIFIFFDPTGAIAPVETLKPFQSLWEDFHHKIHLLLAKADWNECDEDSRGAALGQLVQTVWRLPYIKNMGVIPNIYCPDLTLQARNDGQLLQVIHKAAENVVKKALEQLEETGERIVSQLESRWTANVKQKEKDKDISCGKLMLVIMLIITMSLLCVNLNDYLCRENFTLEDETWSGMIWALKSDKHVIFTVIFGCLFLLSVVKLIKQKTKILTKVEEDLLQKRIRFAYHALHQCEKMSKCYAPLPE